MILIIQRCFKLPHIIQLSLPLVLQVQRSLAAPAQSKTEYEAQPKAAQPATALSKALARVLCATESKENEAKTENPNNPNNGSEEYIEDSGPAGKTQRVVTGTVPGMCKDRLWTLMKPQW